ncbi:MAG: RHS repeat-associated core domain-containing protein [bacterium]
MSRHVLRPASCRRTADWGSLGCRAIHIAPALAAICLPFLFDAPLAHGEEQQKQITTHDGAALQRTRPCVKALDLSREPTTQELMAAGQLGGLLYPTHEMPDKRRGQQANLAFGKAIDAWNRHDYRKAVGMFREHVKAFPDSPWAAEAALHVGCDATYNGRYAEAESIFRDMIANQETGTSPGSRRMANKARQRLALVKVAQNDLDEATALFVKLKQDSPDWRHRTYASHWIQRLHRYAADRRLLADCGTKALARVFRKAGREKDAEAVAQLVPPTGSGHSLRALKDVATGFGYLLTAVAIAPSDKLDQIPLPAILQIPGRDTGDKGHYWVLEEVREDHCELTDPQSGRRFSQTRRELRSQWEGKALLVADPKNAPGRVLADTELDAFCGQCCGAPREPDDQGDPGDNGEPSDNEPDPCSEGAPRWRVNVINMNLFVSDTPLWYEPAIGPRVAITLSYNSQSSIANHEPFGNKWQFNYGGYLVVDTAGSVMIFMPDGRIDVFYPDGHGGYTQPYKVFNTLTKIAENHFELRLENDTVYVYRIPPGTGSQQPFLVEIRDAHGQRIAFGYDAQVNLTTITDAEGRVTTITYNGSGLATNVVDPFGRNARFEYDAGRNLTRITDMGGFWSTLTYDDDVYVTSIGNDRGTWQFWIEPSGASGNSDNYPPPGDPNMWANYRITITDPMGGQEEFFYYGGCDQDGYAGCGGYTWHVSPRYYVPWESYLVNNYRSRSPKTRYLPTQTASGQRGEIAQIVSPNGGTTSYGYDTTTGNRISTTDPHGNHTAWYTYNAMGQMTSERNAGNMLTTFDYASNGVDLLAISNGLGAVRMTYNAYHDPSSLADRSGHTTTFEYNEYGQIVSEVDAMGITNLYVYGPDHRLQRTTRAGQTLETFTYDTVGCVRTRADATGLTLTYDYNNLNSVTRVTYPDGRHEDYTYSTCCPRMMDSATDRAGRLTTYEYDALKRLVRMVNPEKGVTRYEYDADGNRTRLIDPNGNTTSLDYDAENRVVRKTYADGNGLSYAYDPAGLLTNRIGGRGIITRYSYDQNHNLVSINYSDGTPVVTNTYDAYNRLVQAVDGAGSAAYSYDADSRVLAYDGPWPNDTIRYAYDAVGRRTNLVVELGTDPAGYSYDQLNRLTGVSVGSNLYAHAYTNASPLVRRLNRPNGSYTTYAYDTLNRLTGISNRRSTGDVINEFLYTYNAQDLRASETISNGLAYAFVTNEVVRYDYNKLNQLLTSTPPEQLFAYDDDGNMIRGCTPHGDMFTATYDGENRLSTLAHTNQVGIAFSNTYDYAANHFLAQVQAYSNGALVAGIQIVRDGFLDIQERDQAGIILRECVWGTGAGGGIGELLHLGQGSADYACLYDGKGNMVACIDDAQAAAVRYAYDAHGFPLRQSGTLDQPFRFSTKMYDPLSGLSWFGRRFYSPVLGRWLSRDPSGEADDLNLYAFVRQNPVNYIDPLGLRTVTQGDRDGDGVPDGRDIQPDNPDSPQPGSHRNDRDGDGVPDAHDIQPDNPDSPYPRNYPGCERNALGCTDADGDGIPDHKDPQTCPPK